IFGDLGEGISSDIFVEVIVDSEICSVDKDTFFKTVSTDPVSSERLMKQFYNRLIALESRTTSLALDNVEKRFLKLLLSLGELEEDGGKYKTDAFTHEQLAQMLGVSRQTITTLINELEREGVISRHKKQFIFNKKNLLDKLE
ncbi:MAG: Crp/Fnr family transcriptional regulator, partial [Candidatus Paceibacterota bacterium]